MKVLRKHHKYELENFEGSEPQVVQFIEKELKLGGEPGELVTVNDGTTNEELLKVLINRMNGMQEKFRCREYSIVITKLEESLLWLEKRTSDRKLRGAEGKHLK